MRLQLGLEFRIASDSLAVLDEQQRRRCKSQSDEAKHAVSPAQAQFRVQSRASQRYAGAEDGPYDGIRSNGAGGKDRVRVDEVHLHGEEDVENPYSDETCADDGDGPVRVVSDGPAVPEQAHRDQECAGYERREAVLGLYLCTLSRNVSIGENTDGELSNTEANAEAKVGETGLTAVEAILHFENRGECGEEQIHVAVDY